MFDLMNAFVTGNVLINIPNIQWETNLGLWILLIGVSITSQKQISEKYQDVIIKDCIISELNSNSAFVCIAVLILAFVSSIIHQSY